MEVVGCRTETVSTVGDIERDGNDANDDDDDDDENWDIKIDDETGDNDNDDLEDNGREDAMKVEEDTAVAVGSVDDVKAGDGKEVDNNEVDDGEDADIELDDGNNGTEVCVDVSVDAVVVENDDDDDVETEGEYANVEAGEDDCVGTSCVHSVPEHTPFDKYPDEDSDSVEVLKEIEVDVADEAEVILTLAVEEVWVVAPKVDLLVNGHQVVYTVFKPLMVVVAVDNVYWIEVWDKDEDGFDDETNLSTLREDWEEAATVDFSANGHQVVYTVLIPLIVVVAVDSEYWEGVEEEGKEYPEEKLYGEVVLLGFSFVDMTLEEEDIIVLVETVFDHWETDVVERFSELVNAKGKLCVLTEKVDISEKASKELFLVEAKEELDVEEVKYGKGILLICTDVITVGVQIELEHTSVLIVTVWWDDNVTSTASVCRVWEECPLEGVPFEVTTSVMTVGTHLEWEHTSVLIIRVFRETTVVFIISVDKAGKSKLPVVVKFWVPRVLIVSEAVETWDVVELSLAVAVAEVADTWVLVVVASEVAETWVLIVTSEAAGFFAPSDTVEDNTVELEVDKRGIVELVAVTLVITVGVHSEWEQTSVVKTNVLYDMDVV